jgi:hypothetical protein
MAGRPGADLSTLLSAMRTAAMPPDWWSLAACRGDDIALWTPSYREATTPPELAARCSRCPAILPCLAEAIEDDDRCIRAGTSRPERAALVRGGTVVVGDLRLAWRDGAVVVLDPDASVALDLSVLARLDLLLARLAPAVAETAATAETAGPARPARAGPLPATVDAEALRLRQAGSTWRQVAETLGLGRESSARTAAARHSARIACLTAPGRSARTPSVVPDRSMALDLPTLARLEPLLDRLTDPAFVWPAPAPMDALSAARRRLRLAPTPPPPRAAAPVLGPPGASSVALVGNLAASGAPSA